MCNSYLGSARLKDFHGLSLLLHNGRTKFLLFGHSCTGMQGKPDVMSCRVYADKCPTPIFLSSSDPVGCLIVDDFFRY